MHLTLFIALVSTAGDVDAAELLRKAAKDADLLEVVTSDDHPEDVKPQTHLSVKDPKAIAALLALIETRPVNKEKLLHHLCVGHPVTRLSRKGVVVARFSFDHVKFLRPYDERWPGDAEVLPASARAMAAWYAKQGFTPYADQFKSEDDTLAANERYFRSFPKELQRVMRTNKGETVSAADVLAVEKETPDAMKRFTLLCEGLAVRPEVGLLTFEHQTTFALTARVDAVTLEKALRLFAPESPAAKGASRFLFEQNKTTAEVLRGVPLAKARVIVAKYAAVHFADRTRARQTRTAFLTRPFFGVEVEQVLRDELKRPLAVQPEGSCWADEPPQLGALVVLSVDKALNEESAPQFALESLPCAQDRSSIAVARYFRTGVLPALAEFEQGTSREAMEVFVRDGLSKRRDKAAIELGVALIDKSVWVMWELVAWLDGIRTGTSREATYDVMLEVKAWWESARATWPQQ